MRKKLLFFIFLGLLILSGCKPNIMVAQEIANEVELEVCSSENLESFILPGVNTRGVASVNWVSDNPLLEIKYENDAFVCYIKNDHDTVRTDCIITLEITVGKKVAYNKFNFLVTRKIKLEELDYEYGLYDGNNIIITKYIGKANEDVLVIPSKLYYEDGDGDPSNSYLNVKYIGEEAFANNFNGNTSIKKVVIPKGVTEIKKRAFADNKYLEEVTFEDNAKLELIENEAFINNTNLHTFMLPKNLQHIAEKALFGTNITSFTSCDTYEWKDNILIGKNTGLVNNYYAAYVNPMAENIVFPDEVKTIDSFIFMNNTHIKSVDLNQVWAIGLETFKNSTLETIVSSEYITSIGLEAFENTPFLNNQKTDFVIVGSCLLKYTGNDEFLSIPENIETIGPFAINSNTLKTVYIPDNVKDIDTGAFYNCSNLESIYLTRYFALWIGSSDSFGKATVYVQEPYYEQILDDFKWNNLPNEIKIKEVNIKYYDKDGNLLGEGIQTYGSVFEKQIEAPKLNGYKFIGWIDSNGNIHKVNYSFDCYMDEELTAYYEEIIK